MVPQAPYAVIYDPYEHRWRPIMCIEPDDWVLEARQLTWIWTHRLAAQAYSRTALAAMKQLPLFNSMAEAEEFADQMNGLDLNIEKNRVQ